MLPIIAVLTAIIFCSYAWYKKWLTAGGAFAASVMGAEILIAGGFSLAAPMLVFFITGSLFGKLSSHGVIGDGKSKKPRDHIQVLCNGGIAALIILLYLLTGNKLLIPLYFTSIAVSTADTWSSELGVFFGGQVFDIISFKKLATGVSGGISMLGTLAGLAGALVIAISYYFLIDQNVRETFLIAIAGFTGMLLDSIFGSTLQGSYLLQDGSISETPNTNEVNTIKKGFSFMNNDMVNLSANLVITVIILLLLLNI